MIKDVNIQSIGEHFEDCRLLKFDITIDKPFLYEWVIINTSQVYRFWLQKRI